jgi:hypothetical protein
MRISARVIGAEACRRTAKMRSRNSARRSTLVDALDTDPS